ncbi:MAG TPA: tail fiber protein [Chloroflexota bacterium]|nr:tail fiber protein [Chloroflexota bacterium]
MSNPFLAEIRIFAGNFAPKGWATCNGQILPISQNTALFSLLGTTYGGDGRSNFALPNLRGAAPLQRGQGPGLTLRDLGESGGEQTVTLLTSEMPAHTHSAFPGPGAGTALSPANDTWSAYRGFQFAATADSQMSPQAISVAGSSLPHNNMQPYLVLTFIIALQGVFPARS